MFGSSFGSSNSNSNSNGDPELGSAPSETVSSLSWSSKANFIVATSWDKTVRCWEVQASGTTVNSAPKAQHTAHTQPILCSAWHDEGGKVFSAGCDNKALAWDLASNQTQQVGEHAEPIKSMAFIRSPSAGELVVTGGWDKTVKFWDVRQPKCVLSNSIPEKVACMDVKYPLCVVATENKGVVVYNLDNPQTPFKTLETSLKQQTRSVSCMTDKTGYTVGSIEGRVRVEYLQSPASTSSFAFKCHRDTKPNPNLAYPVNAMAFHPTNGTFATAGGDGTFHFWDQKSKSRLKQFKSSGGPITAVNFNQPGDLFAYAVGYDWAKGANGYNEQRSNNHIYIHPGADGECKPKK